jgi:hypothetical protein
MDLFLQLLFNELYIPDTAGTNSALGLHLFDLFIFIFEPLDMAQLLMDELVIATHFQ